MENISDDSALIRGNRMNVQRTGVKIENGGRDAAIGPQSLCATGRLGGRASHAPGEDRKTGRGGGRAG